MQHPEFEQKQIIWIDRDDWQSNVTALNDISLDNIDDQDDETANTLKQLINNHQNKINKIGQACISSQKQISSSLQKCDPNTILIEGDVVRKMNQLIFAEKNRYLVLTCQKLYMFEDKSKQKIIATINFKLLQTTLTYEQIYIYLNLKNRRQNFIFRSIQKQQQWIQQLKKVIKYNQKYQKINNQFLTQQILGEKGVLLQDDFLKHVQTGDLILLNSQGAVPGLQRFVTQSQFDHVAMLVKFRDQVKIFQSNQEHGVNVYDWNQYFSIFRQYNNIAYRRLNYLRKIDAETTLLRFIKKNIGQKYEIGGIKLLKINSTAAWQDQQDRSYFCSELIGKAYKAIGLLQSNKPSAKYWPIDFTQRGELLLMSQAYLERQKIVILNRYLSTQ